MGISKDFLFGQGIFLFNGSQYLPFFSIFNYNQYEVNQQASQYSFRFVNNDGDEDASTFKAALNTNVTLSPNDVARIRFLLDTFGSIGPKNFMIECRHKPSGGSFGPWEPIA